MARTRGGPRSAASLRSATPPTSRRAEAVAPPAHRPRPTGEPRLCKPRAGQPTAQKRLSGCEGGEPPTQKPPGGPGSSPDIPTRATAVRAGTVGQPSGPRQRGGPAYDPLSGDPGRRDLPLAFCPVRRLLHRAVPVQTRPTGQGGAAARRGCRQPAPGEAVPRRTHEPAGKPPPGREGEKREQRPRRVSQSEFIFRWELTIFS